jgi:hypothetical protein
MMICYWKMINPVNFELYSYAVYDSMLPFKDIMLACELMLLISGLKDGYNAYTRYCNDSHFSNANNTSDM